MCAGAWADRGRSHAGGMASFSGILDSFPSDQQEYYADNLEKERHLISLKSVMF